MTKKETMHEIQDLKRAGYSRRDIIRYYERQRRKGPSRPTIKKYYEMDEVPEDPKKNYAKPKAFDAEPFRSEIINILQTNKGREVCTSSIYDVLVEKYLESGKYEKLPGSERTLRNYVHYLEREGLVPSNENKGRIYNYVVGKKPAEQLLIDFGQHTISQNSSIHFICMELRYSRMKFIYAQDHKFNAEEACRAIHRCFSEMGGRPSQLVIDQDAVFVAREEYGDVTYTETFREFLSEQQITAWVCNKADPESKGPIENTVAYLKKSFLGARKITCLDDVTNPLLDWVRRANRKIHSTTGIAPEAVFNEVEREALLPLLPSVYDVSPQSFTEVRLASTPYISYLGNKYRLDNRYAFRKVCRKVVNGKMLVYDENHNFICSFYVSDRKGCIINQIEEQQKDPAATERWVEISNRLHEKWPCASLRPLIDGIKREHGRHITKQLRELERFLDSEMQSLEFVAEALEDCCNNSIFSVSNIKSRFILLMAKKSSESGETQVRVAGCATRVDMSQYVEAVRKCTVTQETGRDE